MQRSSWCAHRKKRGRPVWGQNPGDRASRRPLAHLHDRIKMAINCFAPGPECQRQLRFSGYFRILSLLRRFQGWSAVASAKQWCQTSDEMPHPTGGSWFQLAELKVLSCCETWYNSSSSERPRNRQACEWPPILISQESPRRRPANPWRTPPGPGERPSRETP